MKDEEKKGLSFIPHPSSFIHKLRRLFRGETSARTVVLEIIRRIGVRRRRGRERAQLVDFVRQPALLREEFAALSAAELLTHFRSRKTPEFFPGFAVAMETAGQQQEFFPDETAKLISRARQIATEHRWSLLGFGEKSFGSGEIDWHLDPLSNADWPLTYHADINLTRHDGSDVRVVWELNRLAHLITLGRAYSITNDEELAAEFFRQIASWRTQNPVWRGINWNCAMEVALRAMNLLAAFTLFLRASQMDEESLAELLMMFDQHGAHIRHNLEFSHIATSNHYLADVTGLLWLGVMLPELEAAREWREFGLRELLSEMDKQVLPDGADYEASTGYHRLKVELFLYSFVLCHLNGIDIEEKYWSQLRAMIEYVRAYLRPDGRAPLVGDSDSGQVLPIVAHSGDDHAYVSVLGAAIFREPRFKAGGPRAPEELLWILGERGVRDYRALPAAEPQRSQAFADAGTYVLRADDLYLLFNASGNGVNGRGSHGHNDALGIEVSACGTAFIVDPGSYVYTADLAERHLFRSTAYHSTVQVDVAEQNTTDAAAPFILGDEAHPRVLEWDTTPESDFVLAEHYGYQRLPQPVTHQRRVVFNKQRGFWFLSDRLSGEGEHELSFRFHFAPGLETRVRSDGFVEVRDKINGARLLILARELNVAPAIQPELEARFSSRDYGAKEPSVSACWSVRTVLPFALNFVIVPVCAGEDEVERLSSALDFED